MKRNHLGEKRSARGFTLMEIMIVVGVIGVLLAVAIPSWRRARNASRIAQAKSELALIAQAIEQLAWDTGYYPNGYPKTSPLGRNREVADLSTAHAGLMANNGTYPNWKGPYLRKTPVDPWGKNYIFDPDYYISGTVKRAVISSGPNRSGINAYDDDNIIVYIEN